MANGTNLGVPARHCEERSDEAISFRAGERTVHNDAIASAAIRRLRNDAKTLVGVLKLVPFVRVPVVRHEACGVMRESRTFFEKALDKMNRIAYACFPLM